MGQRLRVQLYLVVSAPRPAASVASRGYKGHKYDNHHKPDDGGEMATMQALVDDLMIDMTTATTQIELLTKQVEGLNNALLANDSLNPQFPATSAGFCVQDSVIARYSSGASVPVPDDIRSDGLPNCVCPSTAPLPRFICPSTTR
jgi:hypothetical protein